MGRLWSDLGPIKIQNAKYKIQNSKNIKIHSQAPAPSPCRCWRCRHPPLHCSCSLVLLLQVSLSSSSCRSSCHHVILSSCHRVILSTGVISRCFLSSSSHHLVFFSYCHLSILSSCHFFILSSCHHHCIVQTGLFAFHICHFVSPPKGKRCHLGAINTVAPDTVLAQKDFPLQNSQGLRYLRLKS